MSDKVVYIVDDDPLMLETIAGLVGTLGYASRSFDSGKAFLDSFHELAPATVLLDVRMPQVDGLRVLELLRKHWRDSAVIMVSGKADVALAVRAMRAGATNFIEKPVSRDELQVVLAEVTDLDRGMSDNAESNPNDDPLRTLTERELEVLQLLVDGLQNKAIASRLAISHRTVEVHRASIMRRIGAKSFADLIRIAIKNT